MNVVLLQQLLAMRAQLEAAILLVEADSAEEMTEVGCVHPADKQRDASTMGGPPMVLCLECGEARPGVVPS